MATTKERILVTLTPSMAREIRAIAKREKTPRATIAGRLMREALEAEEDRQLALVADARAKHTGRWLSHEEVWGRPLKKHVSSPIPSRRARA
jgi:hypothetical protein